MCRAAVVFAVSCCPERHELSLSTCQLRIGTGALPLPACKGRSDGGGVIVLNELALPFAAPVATASQAFMPEPGCDPGQAECQRKLFQAQ